VEVASWLRLTGLLRRSKVDRRMILLIGSNSSYQSHGPPPTENAMAEVATDAPLQAMFHCVETGPHRVFQQRGVKGKVLSNATRFESQAESADQMKN
jgi:hypothetical protein